MELVNDLVKLAHPDRLAQNIDHAGLQTILLVKFSIIGCTTIDVWKFYLPYVLLFEQVLHLYGDLGPIHARHTVVEQY